MSTIKEHYHSSMPLAETKKLILQTLKNVMEEKICTDNVEVTVIPTATKQLVSMSEGELQEIIDQLA